MKSRILPALAATTNARELSYRKASIRNGQTSSWRAFKFFLSTTNRSCAILTSVVVLNRNLSLYSVSARNVLISIQIGNIFEPAFHQFRTIAILFLSISAAWSWADPGSSTSAQRNNGKGSGDCATLSYRSQRVTQHGVKGWKGYR